MNLKRRLASQSTVIFAMRLAGAGMIVLVQAAIARVWGGALLGEYLLVMAVVNLLAMAMPLGFQSVGTYFASEYRANGQRQALWRFLVRAYSHIGFIAVGLWMLGLVLTSPPGATFATWVQGVLPASFMPGVAHYWVQGSLLACAIAVVFINGAVLVGLKRPFAGFFADGLFRPMLVVGAFVLATAMAADGQRVDVMLWAFALGYWVVALVHFGFVVVSVNRLKCDGIRRRSENGRWWRFALPWVLIDLATLYFFDIDLILLSGHMDKETLAIFGVCTRMFSLMAFGITAVYAVSLPDMFESAAKADRGEFHRKVGDANLVAAALSVVLFGLILLAGPFVLLIFGPAFVAGSLPLAILSLALVVRSAFGPAALVLSIHDRPWASLPSIGAGLVVLGIGNFVLVPFWGLTGASLAALLAFSVWSGLMWWTARDATGIDVSIFPRLRRIIRMRAAAH